MRPSLPRPGASVLAALVGLPLGLLHCARPQVSSLSAKAPPPAEAPPVESAKPERGWSFSVAAGRGARELSVEASFARGSPEELSVDAGAEPFVRDVEVLSGREWVKVLPRGSSWFIPACTASGCRVRYRFLLAEAARALDDVDLAAAYGEAVISPPSAWLLHPLYPPEKGELRLSVETPAGVDFITGFRPLAGGRGEVLVDIFDLPDAPYSGFGKFRTARLEPPGGALEVAFAPGLPAARDARLLRWVDASARAVAAYYGRMPIDRALVMMVPSEGHGVVSGKTLGSGGASIVVTLGREVGEGDLGRDWVMVHELLHLAFPSLPRQNLWLEEGLSTYVEPLVRLRAGMLDEQDMWRDFVFSMPQGLPEPGDRGLDNTPTWGRTYWGGALFCLLADVEIRKRTSNQRSLDDALRAIVLSGGNAGVRWTIDQALQVGDRGAGVSVLTELYAKMGPGPVEVDLAGLWRELGIRVKGRRVVFDDQAPLASIRTGISGSTRRAQSPSLAPAQPPTFLTKQDSSSHLSSSPFAVESR